MSWSAKLPITDSAAFPAQKGPMLLEKTHSDDFAFPQTNHLIITTTRGVFSWSSHGVTECFRSSSEGIVAARKANDGTGLLAIADSQVVLLHDINKGMQKSYRLKGSDGQVRLLRYAADSNSLFFTTSLQNTVQSYSLQQSKLLNPSHAHPSPPSIIALSSNSHLLLSASASPPTIHLTNLLLNLPPTLLQPECSSSAVVAAAFHPERVSVFMLAFADGTAAAYDAVHLGCDKGNGGRRSGAAGSRKGGEISHIKKLHAIGTYTTTSSKIDSNDHGYAYKSDTSYVGDRGLGITAMAFVPGLKAIGVTVGADGKCCVVDFATPVRKAARLLHSWHVRAPATSLSILLLNRPASPAFFNDLNNGKVQDASVKGVVIAIGRQDGKVLLFDLGGNLHGEQTLDPDGARVIDVEWLSGFDIAGRRGSKTAGAMPKESISRDTAKPHLAGGSTVLVPLVEPFKTQADAQNNLAANYLDLFSPVKPVPEMVKIGHRSSSNKHKKIAGSGTIMKRKKLPSSSRVAENLPGDAQADGISEMKYRAVSTVKGSPPQIPPRPTRQAKKPLQPGTNELETNITNNVHSITEAPRPTKGLALFAPYMKSGIIGPQKLVGLGTKDLERGAGGLDSEQSEDVWTDITTKELPPARKMARKPQTGSRRTVSLQTSPRGTSEASNDIFVDWSVAATQHPLSIPHAPGISPSRMTQQIERHPISLTQSSASNDVIVEWSSLKPSPRQFAIHQDPPDHLKHIPSPHHPLTTAAVHGSPTAAILTETNPNTQSTARSPPKVPLRSFTNHDKNNNNNSNDENILLCPCHHHQDHTHFQVSLEKIHKTLHDDMQALRQELAQQFQKQKRWFEASMREQEGLVRKVEEENRLLRGELARERARLAR